MIELVHAKLTHTYATTRRLSGMHVGRATMMLSVFQICWSLLKKGGVLDSPKNMLFWQIAQPDDFGQKQEARIKEQRKRRHQGEHL